MINPAYELVRTPKFLGTLTKAQALVLLIGVLSWKSTTSLYASYNTQIVEYSS